MVSIQIPRELLPLDGRFGCGPSKVSEAQLDHLVRAGRDILGTSHRKAPVKNLVGRIREHLASLYRLPDGYEVLLANGSSTAFWDSAAFSLIENRAQNLSFGEFGGKFAKAAAAPFLEAPSVISAASGEVAFPRIEEGIDVYAWPHNETSTGAMAPVTRVDAPGALTVIDGTSAAGGIDIDASQVDVYYFAPQKNFAADGGIWFGLFSPAAIERIEKITASGRYIPEFLSLANAVENSRLNQTLNTPAISTLLLMEKQLETLAENGGLAWADSRTKQSSDKLYRWAESVDYARPFIANPEWRSQVVVTIDFDEKIDAAAVAKALRDNAIVDTEPYRKLGRNQLRIATFTAIDPDDIDRLIRSIEFVVEHLERAEA